MVSAEAKLAAKHYTNQFRWHLFSFELLPAVQGAQARTAFNEVENMNGTCSLTMPMKLIG